MTRLAGALRLTAAALMLAASAAALADKAPVYTGLFSNTALGGYDAVAYFTDGKPVRGDASHAFEWRGARWLFANSEHRDAFAAEPERYAPQFGGYCAWAVSQGYTAKADPEVWAIVDGKLYVNYDAEIAARWRADQARLIQRANANWPKVLDN